MHRPASICRLSVVAHFIIGFSCGFRISNFAYSDLKIKLSEFHIAGSMFQICFLGLSVYHNFQMS